MKRRTTTVLSYHRYYILDISGEPARNAEILTVSSLSQLLHTGILVEPARNAKQKLSLYHHYHSHYILEFQENQQEMQKL